MVNSLFLHAMDHGISPERFWELSIPDIIDIIECSHRMERRKIKHELMNLHFLAKDIGQFTAVAIQGSDKVQVMELWDFFPDLFSEDRREMEKKMQEQQTAVYKAQMIDFLHWHNNSRKGGGS